MSSQSIGFRPQAIIKRIPWSLDKKAALGFVIILTTFSLVGWLYLGQASIITSSTLRIDDLRQEVGLLAQQNNELRLEIAKIESINNIQERARSLGFSPTTPEQIQYLVVRADNPAITSAPEISYNKLYYPNQPSAKPVWQVWLDDITAWITGAPTDN